VEHFPEAIRKQYYAMKTKGIIEDYFTPAFENRVIP
jgi:hypothetical protein